MSEQEQQLKRIVDLLDFHLGDSDNYLPAEPMTPPEFEEEYPVVAAMQIAVKLMLDARAARTQGADDARPVASSAIDMLSALIPMAENSDSPVRNFSNALVEIRKALLATRDTATRAQAPDSAADAWVSTGDRLPDEEIEVLATGWAWNDRAKGRYYALGKLISGAWFKSDCTEGEEELYPPTHWMLLPASPSAHATNKETL